MLLLRQNCKVWSWWSLEICLKGLKFAPTKDTLILKQKGGQITVCRHTVYVFICWFTIDDRICWMQKGDLADNRTHEACNIGGRERIQKVGLFENKSIITLKFRSISYSK